MNKVKNYFFEEDAVLSASDVISLSILGSSLILALYAVSKMFL